LRGFLAETATAKHAEHAKREIIWREQRLLIGPDSFPFWFEYFAWFAVPNTAVASRIVLIEIGVHWTKLGA
jgi:hypothetical protein